MLLTDIFERILVKSGQFLLRVDNIELDPTRFKVLVEDALVILNKHRPIDRHVYITVNSPRTYTFSEELDGIIPYSVVDAVPVRPSAVNPYMLNMMGLGSDRNEYMSEKGSVPFEYRKPNLTVSFSGDFDVHCIDYYEIISEQDDSGAIVFSIPELTINESYFFELLRGMFLQTLGRSRRSFTLNDLPIAMDADQITAEGENIIENAMEDLIANAKTHLAFGG